MTFSVTFPVRFADCDPAGIAYFPRLLALVDAAVEDWTDDALGCSRRSLHLEKRLGLPTVQLEAGFRAPARLGDRLNFRVRVEHVGTTSLTLLVECGALSTRMVQVLTDLQTMRPCPWPVAWHKRLAALAEEKTP